MNTIERLRKHGYRKWYERQLIESHLYLVTLVLALIVMVAGMEMLSLRRTAQDVIFDGTLIVGGAWLSWYCWRRYALAMMVAEHVGHQAQCPACKRLGFRAVPIDEAGGSPLQLVAACPRCGHRWPIDPGA